MMGRLGLGFFVIVFVSLGCVCEAFTPADNYLIDCGSPTNTTVGDRVFVADDSASTTLTTPQTILANTTSNSVSSLDSSALYRTARIFTGPSSYSFPIWKPGRHFIRLYFFPFVHPSYDLAAANFTVSTQDSVLLNNFQAPGGSSATFKEFSVNITHHTLILSFIPLGSNSIAFINALEVVSVPDDLIADTAETINPWGRYHGLAEQLLETVYRINMGGPKVVPSNDSLGRSWINDESFILDTSLAKPVLYSGSIKHLQGMASPETGPDIVYSTATELAGSTSNALFNVTWQFDVSACNTYLIRMHFCDIVSKTLNELYFNVFIGGSLAVRSLDLSSLTINNLAAAYFMDFVVTNAPSKISISIGPSNVKGTMPDAILNGLEVMKMSSSGSVAVVSPHASKSSTGAMD